MTTLQIDTNDKKAIEEIKKILLKKFQFKIRVVGDFDKSKKNNLEEKLKILKSYKFKREGNLAKAFSSLNKKTKNRGCPKNI